MSGLLLYALLTPALFYLGSRATITRALWSRYPPRFAAFMDCPACTGFWWGLVLALTIGWATRVDALGLDPRDLLTPIMVGLCSITWTPIVAGIMQRGFDALGSAVAAETPDDYGDYAHAQDPEDY